VLGAITAAGPDGTPLDLRGPRHRALLGRLVAAGGRTVPVPVLVDALWPDEPPPRAVGSIRTFVGDLRRALEPERPSRAPATVVVTEGDGYALRLPPAAVDVRRFEAAVAQAVPRTPAEAVEALDAALALHRGTPYAEAGDAVWARHERDRLADLVALAALRRGTALVALGRAADAVPSLVALAADRPRDEQTHETLARALYAAGRPADALDVVRRVRRRLAADGLDPAAGLDALEVDLLRHAPAARPADDAFARAVAASARITPAHSRLRLESTVTLLRALAVSGGPGLAEARAQRADTVAAAERVGDPALVARVIGGFDVPSVWPRSDDPEASAAVAAAALRALDDLDGTGDSPARARLHAVVAVELRGRRSPVADRSASTALALARELGDPELLCIALAAVVVRSCDRPGLSRARARLADEIVGLARRHDLPTFLLHGLLVRMQSATAVGDLVGAEAAAAEVDELARRHERPLAHVFTRWNAAARTAARAEPGAEQRYRDAAGLLPDAGMPGVAPGLLALALVGVRGPDQPLDDLDAGPYDPWLAPLRHVRAGDRAAAAALLDVVPEPPPGLLLEALWVLVADAAGAVGHAPALARAADALAPARGELAGGATGMLVLGRVADRLPPRPAVAR
jgi:DNA-binding SARP family transcriptional activator